jgi:hypothetical protein
VSGWRHQPGPVRISIVQYFEEMPDLREGTNAVHKLIDIIVTAMELKLSPSGESLRFYS